MGLQISPRVTPVSPTFDVVTAKVMRADWQYWGPGNTYFGLNVAQYNNFAIGPLTANTQVYFLNPDPGLSGFIWVQQDAVGGRTFTIAGVGGWSNQREENITEFAVKPEPNSVTRYAYMCFRIAGFYVFEITRAKLATYVP